MRNTLLIAALIVGALLYWIFGSNANLGSGRSPEVLAAHRDRVLDYAMEHQPADAPYMYEAPSLKGSVTASAAYNSKSGATCRSYQEEWTVDNQPQAQAGIACKRAGREGWCRLQRGDALTCALEQGQTAAEIGLRKGERALDSMKSKIGF